MKKYDGVLKRVREVELKKGVVYAKPDGRLYKTLRLFFLLAFIYNFFMNLFYVWGMYLHIDAGHYKREAVFANVISIVICTVLSIIGLILLYCKVHLISGVLNVVPLLVTVFIYAPLLKADVLTQESFFGYKEVFFWRHLIPVAVLVTLAVWMTTIAVRAKLISDDMYKKVVDDLFDIYKIDHKEEEIVSAEGWENFLKNYNPDDYKVDNKKKNKKSKKAKNISDEAE